MSAPDKLSAEDARSLAYFHEEKGDMSCLVSWGQLKPILKRDYPEVLAAREQVRVAQRTLDAVVKAMVDRAESEEDE